MRECHVKDEDRDLRAKGIIRNFRKPAESRERNGTDFPHHPHKGLSLQL